MRLPYVVREYSGCQGGSLQVQHQRIWLPAGGDSGLWRAAWADGDLLSAAACGIDTDFDASGAESYASVGPVACFGLAARGRADPGDGGVGRRAHGETGREDGA